MCLVAIRIHSQRCGRALALLIMLAAAPPALADQPDHWALDVSPLYLWAKNLQGTSAFGGPETAIDLDFNDDILENLDSSFALHLEAQRGRLTLYGETNVAALGPSATTQLGGTTITANVHYDDVMREAGAFWTLAESTQDRLQAMVAMRYFAQDVTVKVSPDSAQVPNRQPLSSSSGDSWWNGVAGVRYTRTLSHGWSARIRADYGYGGSHNQAMQGMALFNYQFRRWGSAFIGYRFLRVDYDNQRSGTDHFLYDVDQQGPILGASFHFQPGQAHQ